MSLERKVVVLTGRGPARDAHAQDLWETSKVLFLDLAGGYLGVFTLG